MTICVISCERDSDHPLLRNAQGPPLPPIKTVPSASTRSALSDTSDTNVWIVRGQTRCGPRGALLPHANPNQAVGTLFSTGRTPA